MNREEGLARLASERVARMATCDAQGRPHVVPIVFALEGETLYSSVDNKPKRTKDLKRLENIRANPNVEVLVDRYSEDWTDLWWVRVAGPARLLESGPERDKALRLLTEKYAQYADYPPDGRVVAIDISRVSSWVGIAT
jgi:PPOX class probable F420-dependent enzyme